jgi:hypothetical protein
MLQWMKMDDALPSSLMDSNGNPKVKTTEGDEVGACWSSGMGLEWLTSNSLTHTDLHKTKQQVG